MIKFLVELTNDTSTAVFLVGTPAAEQVFTSQEHLKRRTRGIRLLPLKPDGTYRRFLEQLWTYQFTATTAPLSEKIANKLFDFSGGIPAYIIKIFQESQVQALLYGQKHIDERNMQRAIDVLAIKVPKTYAGGIYISDFEMECADNEIYLPETPAKQMVPPHFKDISRPLDLHVASKLADPTETTKSPLIPKGNEEPIEQVKPAASLESISTEPIELPKMPVNDESIMEQEKLVTRIISTPAESTELFEPQKNNKELVEQIKLISTDEPSLEPSVSRLYANQRGRKVAARDEQDLAAAFQSGCDIIGFLDTHNLLIEWTVPC